MNVSCGSCQTVFRVDPEKVPSAGVRARCSVCSGVFWVRREAPSAPPTPIRELEPTAAQPHSHTAAPAPPPLSRTAAPEPPPPAPAPALPHSRTAAPTSRPGPAVTPPASRPVAPSWAAPPPAAPAPPPPAAAPPAATPPAAPPPLRPSARPTNPFLSQDPQARARRLARALVSDIVVYHPAKRRDGLRDGSLKLLFEDEIRKSWEEYVEQVGRELAEATSFFTDALNDILADGQPVFP